MPAALFLDLGSATGVAFDSGEPGVPVTRLWRLPRAVGSPEEGYEYGAVFATFRRDLGDLVKVVQPALVGFEAAINVMGRDSPARTFKTTQHTIRLLYGFVTVTEEFCATHNLRCYEAHISTIKKHLTGSGRAEKGDVLAACKRLNWDVGGDHNRADAAAGWCYIKAISDKAFSPRSLPLFSRGAA